MPTYCNLHCQCIDCPFLHLPPKPESHEFFPFLAFPLPLLGLTYIDPAVLHRGWDGPEEPASQAQALVVDIPHDLVAFTIDASGTQSTCHQRQTPMDLGTKGRHCQELGTSGPHFALASSSWRWKGAPRAGCKAWLPVALHLFSSLTVLPLASRTSCSARALL